MASNQKQNVLLKDIFFFPNFFSIFLSFSRIRFFPTENLEILKYNTIYIPPQTVFFSIFFLYYQQQNFQKRVLII